MQKLLLHLISLLIKGYPLRLLLWAVLLYTSTPYNARAAEQAVHFKPEKIERFKQQKEFAYWKYEEGRYDIYNEIREWVFKALKMIFGNEVSLNIIHNLHWIFLSIGLLLVILYLGKLHFQSIAPADNPESYLQQYKQGQEADAELMDIKALIGEALARKDFRLAVRYYYLEVLKHLSDDGLIKPEPFKTNSDYLHEIGDEALRKQFGLIARLYEYIWYGDRQLKEEDFLAIEPEFKQISKPPR